jgi:cytochrome P450
MPYFIVATVTLSARCYNAILQPLYFDTLSAIPEPKIYALTKWRLAWEDWTGQRTRAIHALHLKYRPILRIGPSELHFNSLSALRTIYGAGSGFERTCFYRMFDVYGRKNLFTFASGADHAKRKRLLARSYSKSGLDVENIIHNKVRDFLGLVDTATKGGGEGSLKIFAVLHYYALDDIMTFLYGTEFGATAALQGTQYNTVLLDDIMNPARRRLSWFAVHLPSLTRCMCTQTGFLDRLVEPFLPMAKPATYTDIRAHVLRAMETYRDADQLWRNAAQGSVIAELYDASYRHKADLDSLDIASECADHLLVGINTTGDTVMFLIWCLSLPQNAHVQQKLIEECQSLPNNHFSDNAIDIGTSDSLPCFNAVLKETLRLFAPLPASEPRWSPIDTTIDGYDIPQGTVCSMAPYSLHRNEDTFLESLKWKPERWLI